MTWAAARAEDRAWVATVLPEGERPRRIVGWVRLSARTVCATNDRALAPFERVAMPPRRAKAQELVERLLAEGRVRITDPSDDEVAEWRRVVNYAKRHGMEPEGRRIEKVPYGGLGLEFFLAEGGPHPNARSRGRRRAVRFPCPRGWRIFIRLWLCLKTTTSIC